MTVFGSRDDNKSPDKHVEADTDVVSGRGFDSPRLHCLQTPRNCVSRSCEAFLFAQAHAGDLVEPPCRPFVASRFECADQWGSAPCLCAFKIVMFGLITN